MNIIYNILLSIIVLIITIYLTVGCNGKIKKRPIWPCINNKREIYYNKVNGRQTSMLLLDPYSMSHITHGLLLYNLFYYLNNKKHSDSIFIKVLVSEIIWEIIENTDYVVNLYRKHDENSRYYNGDSIINSIGDIFSCMIGSFIAYKFPNCSIYLALLNEITMYMLFKSSLIIDFTSALGIKLIN